MLIGVYIAIAYLSGSVPYGVIVGRACGADLRREGSGNIGATNAYRVIGIWPGVLVLILDATKAAAPTAAALSMVDTRAACLCSVAAILGHCAPVWLRFRGGKGVAPTLGAFLVLVPAFAGVAVLVFAATFALTRIASLSSLVASVAFLSILWVWGESNDVLYAAAASVTIIVLRHISNLQRLGRGEELSL